MRQFSSLLLLLLLLFCCCCHCYSCRPPPPPPPPPQGLLQAVSAPAVDRGQGRPAPCNRLHPSVHRLGTTYAIPQPRALPSRCLFTASPALYLMNANPRTPGFRLSLWLKTVPSAVRRVSEHPLVGHSPINTLTMLGAAQGGQYLSLHVPFVVAPRAFHHLASWNYSASCPLSPTLCLAPALRRLHGHVSVVLPLPVFVQ